MNFEHMIDAEIEMLSEASKKKALTGTFDAFSKRIRYTALPDPQGNYVISLTGSYGDSEGAIEVSDDMVRYIDGEGNLVHTERMRSSVTATSIEKYYAPTLLSRSMTDDMFDSLMLESMAEDEMLEEAEYKGREVTLNKPFSEKSGGKKFAVYVKNEKGNVIKLRFGDASMTIKKDDPARRKSFRARHNCDDPGPKWKARYWSCKKW